MNLSGQMDKAMRLVYDMRQTYVILKATKNRMKKLIDFLEFFVIQFHFLQ